MRNTFAKVLVELARKDESIFLITGDLGFSVLEPFANEFPDRYLNIGIAEQNMIGVAAGLAKEGYNVFTYSIGNFPTLRCMEQIRYDIAYHNLNVKVIAVGAGYAYGPLGVSHHTTEDIGMLRTIPNLTVTSPADPMEVTMLTLEFCRTKGPGYMRINKTGEPILHSEVPAFQGGRPLKLVAGKDKLLIGTGAMVQEAIKWSKEKGYELWSFPVISPMQTDWINADLLKFSEIITVEEHQLNSGFGSAILEVLSDAYHSGKLPSFPKVRRIGIPNEFIGHSGSQEFLRKEAGLFL